MSRCVGCGALLQANDTLKPGYIPKEKMDTKLCMRCFRLIHYNDLQEVEVISNEKIINQIPKDAFCFFLTDLLNINEEVMHTYHKLPNACLLISKSDLIPKYIKLEELKKKIKKIYKVEEEITFLSTFKQNNIRFIQNKMEEYGLNKAYLVGYSNSGKSTLLNKIRESKEITTSYMPNTTNDFMTISIEDKVLIDSPGFQYEYPIYKEDTSLIKKLNPKTYLHPITYQLKKKASIILEGMIRIENKSEVCNMTCYLSNLLDLQKVYENNDSLKDLEVQDMQLEKNSDIVIKGVGFITINTTANLTIYCKKKEIIEIRKSFFGGKK